MPTEGVIRHGKTKIKFKGSQDNRGDDTGGSREGARSKQADHCQLGKRRHRDQCERSPSAFCIIRDTDRVPGDAGKVKVNQQETCEHLSVMAGGPGIVGVILKALAYNPADRYQSALEFGNDIKRCISSERSSENSYACEDENVEEYRPNAFDIQTETEILIGKNDRQIRHEAEISRSREQNYLECISLMRTASCIPEYENAKTALMSLNGYKDADKLVEECQEEINRLNEQKRLEEEQDATIQKRETEEASRKRKKLAGILAVAALARFH